MASAADIDAKLIRAYIKEAIKNQKAGKEIKAQLDKPLLIPSELKAALLQNPKAKSNLEAFIKSKNENLPSILPVPSVLKPKPQDWKRFCP